MKIDITNITQMSNPQIIELAHNVVGIPAILITFFSLWFFEILIGLLMVSTSDARKKIFFINLLAFLFGGIVVLILIFAPNFTQKIVDVIVNLFS